jgi:hypothetical protein
MYHQQQDTLFKLEEAERDNYVKLVRETLAAPPFSR